MLKQKTMNKFAQLEVYMQLNLDFLNKGFITKQKYFKYIKQGYIQFLGTDCHRKTDINISKIQEYRSQLEAKLTVKELQNIR